MVALVLMVPFLSRTSHAQQGEPARRLSFPASIHWNRQEGVEQYRLQVAADEKFRNVFLDKRVVGDHYVVNELAPGFYYWRVSPAADLQVREFSRPVRFFISGGLVTKVNLSSRPRSPGTAGNRKVQSPGTWER